jgi:hypothetical protein
MIGQCGAEDPGRRVVFVYAVDERVATDSRKEKKAERSKLSAHCARALQELPRPQKWKGDHCEEAGVVGCLVLTEGVAFDFDQEQTVAHDVWRHFFLGAGRYAELRQRRRQKQMKNSGRQESFTARRTTEFRGVELFKVRAAFQVDGPPEQCHLFRSGARVARLPDVVFQNCIPREYFGRTDSMAWRLADQLDGWGIDYPSQIAVALPERIARALVTGSLPYLGARIPRARPRDKKRNKQGINLLHDLWGRPPEAPQTRNEEWRLDLPGVGKPIDHIRALGNSLTSQATSRKNGAEEGGTGDVVGYE